MEELVSILEEYEKRFKMGPLSPDEILKRIELAEACLESPGVGVIGRLETERVIVWLHDRLQAIAVRAGTEEHAPNGFRCGWCFRAAGCTDESWRSLPTFTLDAIRAHTEICEHNPLVQRCRAAEAALEDLRGRRIGSADAWADAADEATQMYQLAQQLHDATKRRIRTLLKTELPAGELRKALEELVR
jgi:hypothetical protein